jgi:hypothetical protein
LKGKSPSTRSVWPWHTRIGRQRKSRNPETQSRPSPYTSTTEKFSMQRTTFILFAIVSVAVVSVLYLVGGTTVSAGSYTDTGARYAPSPFEQHTKEAVEGIPNLAQYIESLEKLRERNANVTRSIDGYLAHTQQYFEQASQSASSIQDSTLRSLTMGKLAAAQDSAKLRQTVIVGHRQALTQISTRAEDLEKTMRLVGSIQYLAKWGQAKMPESAEIQELIRDYHQLVAKYPTEAALVWEP